MGLFDRFKKKKEPKTEYTSPTYRVKVFVQESTGKNCYYITDAQNNVIRILDDGYVRTNSGMLNHVKVSYEDNKEENVVFVADGLLTNRNFDDYKNITTNIDFYLIKNGDQKYLDALANNNYGLLNQKRVETYLSQGKNGIKCGDYIGGLQNREDGSLVKSFITQVAYERESVYQRANAIMLQKDPIENMQVRYMESSESPFTLFSNFNGKSTLLEYDSKEPITCTDYKGNPAKVYLAHVSYNNEQQKYPIYIQQDPNDLKTNNRKSQAVISVLLDQNRIQKYAMQNQGHERIYVGSISEKNQYETPELYDVSEFVFSNHANSPIKFSEYFKKSFDNSIKDQLYDHTISRNDINRDSY